MKKANIFLSLSLLIAITLVSCSEESVNFDNVGGVSMAAFQTAGSEIKTNATTQVIDSIYVDVTTVSSSDRGIVLTVDDANTSALPAMYTVEPAVIKAGQYNGLIRVFGNYAAFADTKKYKLTLKLTSVEGAAITTDINYKSHSITLSK